MSVKNISVYNWDLIVNWWIEIKYCIKFKNVTMQFKYNGQFWRIGSWRETGKNKLANLKLILTYKHFRITEDFTFRIKRMWAERFN